MIGVRRDNIPLMRVGAGGGQWEFKNLIGWAIGIGVIFGLVFAFISPSQPPDSIPTSVSKSDSQVASSKSESTEVIKKLEAQSKQASLRIAELERKIRGLNRELELKGGESMNQKRKAGPFGTVKGTRTSPTVIPDESLNPRLSEILKKVAVDRELIVALANSNVKEMLEVWFQSIKKVGIPNYLVIALDDEMVTFCQENDVPVYKRDPDERIDGVGREGGNHAVSGLKFAVLREFLQLGYSVILSDIDIVYLQNPFNFLYRDSDVESMTDGHDNMTAYGYDEVFDDPSMGWARYVHTMRIWVYNSGFFYIRPTIPSIELLDRVRSRLAIDPDAWDQSVFNEELFYPSHPGYDGLHASRRTMDYFLFMNSKVLFKIVRDDETLSKEKPVIVHVNYHPDKLPRMKAVVEHYFDGIDDALESLPDGTD